MEYACKDPLWSAQSLVNVLRQFFLTIIQAQVPFPRCATKNMFVFFLLNLVSLGLLSFKMLCVFLYFTTHSLHSGRCGGGDTVRAVKTEL